MIIQKNNKSVRIITKYRNIIGKYKFGVIYLRKQI